MSYTPGPTQIAILRTVAGGEAFTCTRPSHYMAALKLLDRGLLDRDPRRGKSHTFMGNDTGTTFIRAHDDALEARLS